MENHSTVLREPEHGSPRTRARFSENQSTVLREPEHGSLRTRERFSENQSTVLREPEHGSLRTGAHLSWRTGKHLHVLHVLRTYSTCSYPGYQDTTTYAALHFWASFGQILKITYFRLIFGLFPIVK